MSSKETADGLNLDPPQHMKEELYDAIFFQETIDIAALEVC